ncbi:amino acid permease-domain-containing protein [Mycena rosella]|uniref:Amino acid permease-domain-containing protein n=1 Tax=Mycena rosella TaxID=1033263 RepID=A0AAD7GYS5_MYCRO|nr:amino acid permease-domain-containing protein [Mycena rosella]
MVFVMQNRTPSRFLRTTRRSKSMSTAGSASGDEAAPHSDDPPSSTLDCPPTVCRLVQTLGTGLFLSSGKAIAHVGSAGALLVYMHVGTICYCMLIFLGEMMCYMPISSGYIHFAERFLDPALGFALGCLLT